MTDLSVSARPKAGDSVSNRVHRRLRPRIWDTDWLVLRGMQTAITQMAERVARPGQTVIDFGCGDRPYAQVFDNLGCRHLGADFGDQADLAIDSDGRLEAANDSADGVASIQVLEHVRDLKRYFGEARRVLRDEGWMILSTHGSWLYHPHPEDHRRWTRPGLAGEIEAHGFDVVADMSIVGPLAWTTMLRLASFSFALKKAPFIGPPLAGALATIMNARAWLEDKVTPAWVTRDNACVYVMLCRSAAAPQAGGADF